MKSRLFVICALFYSSVHALRIVDDDVDVQMEVEANARSTIRGQL